MLRFFVAACVLITLLGPSRGDARPRYYVELAGVGGLASAKGAPCDLSDTKRLVAQLLAAQPEVTTRITGASKGSLAKALKAQRLLGYRILFRVTRCQRDLDRPKPGRPFRQFRVLIETAVDAEKIPSRQMALAGVGQAELAAEVSKASPRELQSVVNDTLREASKRAIKRFMEKIKRQPPKGRRGRKKRS